MAIEPNPLAAVESARGAVLRVYGGLELPEKFADAMAEYDSVRHGAGLFDLSFRGPLRFTGTDRASFLHNLLTNDVASLRPGDGCYAALLTQQSRVVADANVYALEDSILLDLDLRLMARAREHLEKHLVADDVEIEDASATHLWLGVHGARALDALRAAVDAPLPEAALSHAALEAAGVPVRVARTAWTGALGYDLLVARDRAAELWEALLAAGAAAGLRPAGMVAFNVLRVEAGIPWVGVDVDESHLVLEAGLERAINFRKGCYLGQEVVERASARGHVNRRLVGLRIAGRVAPPSGAKLWSDGKEIGQVTSAVLSPAVAAPIALAYVRREHVEPGSRIEVDVPSGRTTAEVVSMPFSAASAAP